MNESMQKAVAAMIEKAISGVDAATSFLAAEIPDVIHQLLMWNMVKSIVITLSYLIVLFCIYLVIRFVYKKVEASENPDHYLTVMVGIILGGLVGTFCVAGVVSNTLNALQIWIAPKVWLIEYAAKLVK